MDRVAQQTAPSPAGMPPGPTRAEFLRTYRLDPLGTLLRLAREYGDIVYLFFRGNHAFLVTHPDHAYDILVANSGHFMKGPTYQEIKWVLGEGLVTSDGPHHRRQRRLASPAMHHQRLIGYSEVMTDLSRDIAERWTPGQVVDVDWEMMQYGLGVVCKTLFGVDLSEDDTRTVRDSIDTFNRAVNFFVTGKLFGRFEKQILALQALNDLVFRIIKEHRAKGTDQGDLLSMLLMARDDEVTGEQMDDEQVRDEAVTLIVTGHETTATTLTWALYLLSQTPEADAEMYEELDRVLGGRAPTHEDMDRLPFTHKVLQETLRLYPPGWMFERTALVDHQFGDYTLPTGGTAVLCPYLIHRDPRFWDDPMTFNPWRWTEEAEKARPRFAYFPFGGGPRFCYGEAFAWMEATLALASIAQRWRLKLAPGHEVTAAPHVTIRPKGGLPMIAEARR